MGVIAWIIFGLIAGVLAKWLMPGTYQMGFIMTTVLGIVGAVVGDTSAHSLVKARWMALTSVVLLLP